MLPVAAALLLASGCASTRVIRAGGDDGAVAEAVAIFVPEVIEIFSVNDQRLSGTAWAWGKTQLRVEAPPGYVRIVARYRDWWPAAGDQYERMVSSPVVLQWYARPGARYRLMVKVPANADEARALAAKPEIKVVTDPDGTLAAIQSLDAEPRDTSKPWMEWMRPGTETNALPQKAEATTPTGPRIEPGPEAAFRYDALRDMQDVWRRASPEQREEFRRWMRDQPE